MVLKYRNFFVILKILFIDYFQAFFIYAYQAKLNLSSLF